MKPLYRGRTQVRIRTEIVMCRRKHEEKKQAIAEIFRPSLVMGSYAK